MKHLGLILGIVIGLLLGNTVNATVINVPLGTDVDIQAAIDGASTGDIIQLASGTYVISSEVNIADAIFGASKELTIVGNGSGVTYLDGVNSTYVFYVGPYEIVTIESLTIINGEGAISDPYGFKLTTDGGGLYAYAPEFLTLTDVVFEDCNAIDNGGGMYVAVGGNFVMERTYFLNNSAGINGGGLCVETLGGFSFLSSQISKSSFNGNSSSGLGEAAYFNIASSSDITLDIINSSVGNSASGSASVYFDGAGSLGLTMQNNTIANNFGGGIYFNISPSGKNIYNNIIVDNTDDDIGASSAISFLGYRNLFEKLSSGVTFTGKNYYEVYSNAIVNSSFSIFNGGTVPAMDLTNYGVRVAAGRAWNLFPVDDQNGVTRRARTELGAVETSSNVNVWLGSDAVDQDWSNASNWTAEAVPSTANEYIIVDNCNNSNYPINGATQNLFGVDVVIGNFGAFVNNSPFRLKNLFIPTITGTLYLMSNSSGTGQFLNSNTLTGNVEIEQHLFGNQWNFLGIPVSTITASSLIPDATLATSTLNGGTYTYNNDGDYWIFGHNQEERATYGASDLEWEPVNTGDLYGGVGYIVWCDVAQKAVFTGSLVTTMTQSLFYTELGNVQDRGWNLISNPYLAPFTWDNSIVTDVDQACYYYSNNYQNYFVLSSDPIDGTTEKIPQVQAFFVKANQPDAPFLDMPRTLLAIDVDVKFKNATLEDKHYLKTTIFRDSEKYYDETYIRHKESAGLLYEGEYDAYKLKNFSNVSPQIYTSDGNTDLSINSFSYYDYPYQEVPLMVSVPEVDTYKLAFKIDDSMGDFEYVLEDTQDGTFYDLNDGDTIKIYFDQLVEKSRLIIHVVGHSTAIGELDKDEVMMYSGQGNLYINTSDKYSIGDIRIYDLAGKILLDRQITDKNSIIGVSDIQSQFVIVDYESNNKRFTKRLYLR